MSATTISLDGMVFGMPPGTHVSDSIMLNSMPTATITPCEPKFSEGLSLFTLDQGKGKEEYNKILNSVGYSISGSHIKVAYLADNFPTDTFNNEYGETFLDRFSQAASSGLGDLSQILGLTSVEKIKSSVGKFSKGMKDSGGIGNFMASGAEKIFTGADNTGQAIAGAFGDRGVKTYQSMKSTMAAIATGARVDFPQVWKNSSFTPSYSMTIRLYNPNPGDPESTKKYIVGPIAALVSLGVPKVSEDSTTYKWPLICRVRSEGIYHLNAAYINSIAVIKGGDQQSIGYNQALAMVDVRIDFGSLYNSILAGQGTNKLGLDRPTLGTYLEAIGGRAVTGSNTRKRLYVVPNEKSLRLQDVDREEEKNKTNARTKLTEDRDAHRSTVEQQQKQAELELNNKLISKK